MSIYSGPIPSSINQSIHPQQLVSHHQLIHSSLRSSYRLHNQFFPLLPSLYVYTLDRANLMYATGRSGNVHFLPARKNLYSLEDRGIRGLERCSGLLCPPNELISLLLIFSFTHGLYYGFLLHISL